MAPTIHYGQDGSSAKADRSVAEQALAMLTDESGRYSIAQQHDAYRLYREHKWAMNGEERSEASAQIHNSSYGQRTAELGNKLGELNRSLANGDGDSIGNAKRTIAWFDSLPEWERNHPRLETFRERHLAIMAMFEGLEKREAAGAYRPGQPTTDPEAKLILQLFDKLMEVGKADSPWAKAFEPYLQRGREMLEEDRRSQDVVDLSETARPAAALRGILTASLALVTLACCLLSPQQDAAAQSFPGNGGELLPLTLTDAVALALRDNRDIRSRVLEREVQRLALLVAEDRFAPQFEISARLGRSEGQQAPGERAPPAVYETGWEPSVDLLLPTGARVGFVAAAGSRRGDGSGDYSGSWALQVSQPLLRGGGIAVNRASVAIARFREQQNQLGLKASVIDSVTAVIGAYRALLQAQGQVEIAEDSLDRAVDLLEVNLALVAAGRMAEMEIVQGQANLARQELSLLQARNALDNARVALLQLLALDVRLPVVAADSLAVERVEIGFEEALDLALAERPDYRQSLLAQQIAEQSLLLAENEQLWQLDLTASLSASTTGGRAARTASGLRRTRPGNSVGLALTIPLNDRTREQVLTSARVGLRQQELQLADLTQAVEAAVLADLRALDTAWRSLALAREALSLSEQKLEIEQERLRAGRSSNFQVVAFEADLVAARQGLLAAEIGYLEALTRLDRTLGTTLATWEIDVHGL